MRRIAITPGRLALEQDENAFQRAVHTLAAHAVELADAGVEAILLREKDLAAVQLRAVAEQVSQALAERETRVLVAGPHAPTVAQQAGADGLHFPLSARNAEQIQTIRIAWPEAWLSVSTHSVQEAAAAAQLGVNAVLHAPVFGKWIAGKEVVPGLGLGALRQACAAAGGTPVFALGGVTESNTASCLDAGAAGIAAIRMFSWPPQG